ncbi:MAG: zinc-ribbon domain-containing protein [Desulfuromonadales bacterium]|nr:zinc-ribbon domain-containing protein [Desulfuromonadales bacterium]
MVIICPECSTKFRVNSERIPTSGTKVRCARCKHVFFAEKPVEETMVRPAAPETPAVVAESEQVKAAPAALTPDEPTTVTEPSADELISDKVEESDFSYEKFRELDPAKTAEEDFTFGGVEDEKPTSQETSGVPEDEEDFTFSEPATAQLSEADNQAALGEELDHTPESVADLVPEAAGDESADIFSPEEEIPAEPEVTPEAVITERNGGSSSSLRILLLLLLGLLLIGGALYFINGPEQMQQAIRQLFGQQTNWTTESDRITLANLEGKFINNQEAGELFIIRGEATNNFREARASIQVKGVIFDQNGKPLRQKTIFCGNPISDQELQTLPFSKLEEIMGNQFGKSLNNMKVDSKQALSFVIAFRELPKTLSEFSVDITSSKPVTH